MTATTELRARMAALEVMVGELSKCKAALGRAFEGRVVTGSAGRAYVHLETARTHVVEAVADLEEVARDLEESYARSQRAIEALRHEAGPRA